jgi:hypothetical protein
VATLLGLSILSLNGTNNYKQPLKRGLPIVVVRVQKTPKVPTKTCSTTVGYFNETTARLGQLGSWAPGLSRMEYSCRWGYLVSRLFQNYSKNVFKHTYILEYSNLIVI